MNLCWVRGPLGPPPQPTHDGRSSVSKASPSGHPSPASSHRRSGLFVLPAPCCSLGQGLEETAIFCLGGRVSGQQRCAGMRGEARMGCGRTPGQTRPPTGAGSFALLCLSLPPGATAEGAGIFWLFVWQLAPARSLSPAPCYWVGWTQVSAATRWGVFVRNPRRLMLAVHTGFGKLLWGWVQAAGQLVGVRGLTGGLEGPGHYLEMSSLKIRLEPGTPGATLRETAYVEWRR